ncbi:dihydrodipicolinate synthase family protein [Tepidibacillus sp. HK-1]|uniref:dihydrodipicolinate synthase family protein n=1 Tax=Tepidibacillus sp. HK-1 TaxID=1883407 RepID=UPI000853C078|nr:dihydrodipicolinate synthase family protein [Tepidibacillus sp. HK-1]GBF12240.1 4-hydroxy-tetrahydrodipicolinate synthase [Tepidibacillus sp. HK-1]
MKLQLKGIGVVVATPLNEDGTINEQEYRRHLRWLIKSGVGYVQPAAATGQVMQTTDDEYRRLLKIAVEECKGTGVLVTAYPGRADTAHSVELTKYAAEIGADAAYLVQPLFSRPDVKGLYEHYKAILDAVPGFPIVMYNNPDRTSVQVPIELVERLSEEYPQIIGFKQADPAQVPETFRRFGQKMHVWSRGEFDLLMVLSMGAPGSISFSGNIIAPQLVEVQRLWESGDIEAARKLFYKVFPVIMACHWGPIPSTIKYMMRRTGWNVGVPRLPIIDVDDALAKRVDQALVDAGVIEASELK